MPAPDDTQERLLEAAGQVFAEKGYEGATVREICRRAEVNIAAVNYYFRDKERLYTEAVKSACRCQAEEYPLPDWPSGTPAVAKLRDFIHTFVRRMVDGTGPQWHRQLFLREMAQPTAACAELVRDVIRPNAEVLRHILEELLPGTPEPQRWLIGFSIVGQCLFYRLAQPVVTMLMDDEAHRALSATGLAEHITQFSLAALGLDRPGRRPRRGSAGKPAGK
jgi:AcrR family transcriptional regulator